MRTFDFRGVVVVADLWEEEGAAGVQENSDRRDLEQTERFVLDELVTVIRSLGFSVRHYESPAELALHADEHGSDVVLSIYGGNSSRSRMAVTPAVCEAFGLKFIGPDAYGRIVAQDKEIAKRLALNCGILTPAWRVIRSETEAASAARLTPPVVVKPLLEGSSIGISAKSLQSTAEGAHEVAMDLLRKFSQPVMVEQFVPGREVSYTKIESGSADHWGLSEVVIAGDSGYFNHRLLHADAKIVRDPRRTVRNIDYALAPEDKAAIDRYLGAFGSYGYCRVDGRLCDGRFHFLELTPDAWLGRTGQFVKSYTEKGWRYEQVIAAILASTRTAPPARLSSD